MIFKMISTLCFTVNQSEGITPDTPPPFFPPARSAGKVFSKEIPNKKILLQIPPPFFSRKKRKRGGGIWSDTFWSHNLRETPWCVFVSPNILVFCHFVRKGGYCFSKNINKKTLLIFFCWILVEKTSQKLVFFIIRKNKQYVW